uniref:Uncharacterized protein n=1 Tax=Oryza meridionalis TaxID=40149 RepID=A0A0E0C1N6_9ORYZ
MKSEKGYVGGEYMMGVRKVAYSGGQENSEAPTVVRIKAWGGRRSTSTLGLGFAGLYNQRFDVGALWTANVPMEGHEQHREGERQGAGAPVAGRRRRRRWNVFPRVAQPGKVVAGKGSERGGRNGAAKNSAPAG